MTKSGTFTDLYNVTPATGGTNGDYPAGAVFYDKAGGTIYGTTSYGGASGGSTKGCVRSDGTQINPYGRGTVFSLTK